MAADEFRQRVGPNRTSSEEPFVSNEAERRAVVEGIRNRNETEFGTKARQAVQKLLAADLPHPWMYVYELTQNARDAGARKVSWRADGTSVVFQHDGDVALDDNHIEGIASLGASTKGLGTVGFMGVGFKSVFARFRTARISGFGWRLRFDVQSRDGDFGSTVPEWFDTLLPVWDESASMPSDGYTTSFRLERPADPTRQVVDDLAHLASPNDLTPLAVLALRGLEQVRVDDVTWDLSVRNGTVEVRTSADSQTTARWKSFAAKYRPSDHAMRRLLEVRQETHEQVDATGQRAVREVVALLPLDAEGLPNPPKHGRVYTTLPTQAQIPFGFHLQADWFVGVDRQHLREVVGDPWQESIIRQIPVLVRDLMVWLARGSDEERVRGYAALCNPEDDDGHLAPSFRGLAHEISSELSDLTVVPIHGEGPRAFTTPTKAMRLPGLFLETFGEMPGWRPDLLFGHEMMDEALLGERGSAFARWLEWGDEPNADDVSWAETLPTWWEAVPEAERYDALFGLWDCVGDCGWNWVPVVQTEGGTWVPPRKIVWLNELPPTEREPCALEVGEFIRDFLPDSDERVSIAMWTRVNSSKYNPGVKWLRARVQTVELAAVIREACEAAADDAPLVELLQWALGRNSRTNLVPMVLTDSGPVPPTRALLADPFVEGGRSRRILFPHLPAVSPDYQVPGKEPEIKRFLEQLGVAGSEPLRARTSWFGRSRKHDVAKELGIDPEHVAVANDAGYEVYDYTFPFEAAKVPPEALQDWLSREYNVLRDKGRKSARSSYHVQRVTPGETPSTWIRELREIHWVRCRDGERRRPAEVLLEPDIDYEEAPIADIDVGLAERLTEEGMKFGAGVARSPALRRLVLRGASGISQHDLATLLLEAIDAVASGSATDDQLRSALEQVRIDGRVPLNRVVERTGVGTGNRSDLGGWVVALSELHQDLRMALRKLNLELPPTTTNEHALAFLRTRPAEPVLAAAAWACVSTRSLEWRSRWG